MPLTGESITTSLSRLGFGIRLAYSTDGAPAYDVQIPSWRVIKQTPWHEQDIVEEVLRNIGYDTLKPVLPAITRAPKPTPQHTLKRQLETLCAYTLGAHEIKTYPVYDSPYLARIGLQVPSWYTVANPLAQDHDQLASSLVPGMLGSIDQQSATQDHLEFFQINTCWPSSTGQQEHLVITWSHKHIDLDWYTYKHAVEKIMHACGFTTLTWRQVSPDNQILTHQPWWLQPMTAQILVKDTVVGIFGAIKPTVCQQVNQQSILVAQITLDVLAQVSAPTIRYKTPSRYQSVSSDISMLVPYAITYDQICQTLRATTSRIHDIHLVDRYDKVPQEGYRAYTLRYTLVDQESTMDKVLIDTTRQALLDALIPLNIRIRS